MTLMQQKLQAAGLKASKEVVNDIQRKEADIQKPKWMQKAEKKFAN